MLNDVLGNVASAYAHEEVIEAALDRETIQIFAQSKRVKESVTRILGGHLYPEDTARLYAGEKFAIIAEAGDWRVSLFVQDADAPLAYSIPGPVVLCPIVGDGVADISIYDVDGLDVGPLAAKGTSIGRPRVVKVPINEPIYLDPTRQVFHIAADGDRTVWLRFAGPFRGKYTHAYHVDSGSYAYSTFSNHESTGLDFLAKVVRSLSVSGVFTDFDDVTDQANAAKLVSRLLDDPACASITSWTLIQALERLAPAEARQRLERFVEANDEFARQGNAALAAMASQGASR
jgi:hypothetical protein